MKSAIKRYVHFKNVYRAAVCKILNVNVEMHLPCYKSHKGCEVGIQLRF